jgi:hypothetical protein
VAVSELLARVQAFALGANAAGLAIVERVFGVGSNPGSTVVRAASVGHSPGTADAPSSWALAALAGVTDGGFSPRAGPWVVAGYVIP